MRRKNVKRAMILGLVVLGFLVMVVVRYYGKFHPLATRGEFHGRLAGLTYDLNDLGVADINNDGWLDAFTTNHSNAQLIAVNDEGDLSESVELERSLSQAPAFPRVERQDKAPVINSPGIYVYWLKGSLYVESNGANGAGAILLPRELKIDHDGDVDVEVGEGHTVRFRFRGSGRVTLASYQYYFLPRFQFDESVAPDTIFVGFDKVSPKERIFELPEQDRHAMAWLDFDGDADMDVMIFRGGGEGQLAETYPDAVDELLLWEDGEFRDVTRKHGLKKNGMPARSACWVDLNRDGLLDLYVVNGRSLPPNKDAPNQAFVRDSDGGFVDRAPELGLDIKGDGRAIWRDFNLDGMTDLVWFGTKSVESYVFAGGKYIPTEIMTTRRMPSQVATADFDGDGDHDLIAASKSGNFLLRNDGGLFVESPVGKYGLPDSSRWVNWVDYDNDGLMDCYLLPQGMFKQVKGGVFVKTGILELKTDMETYGGSWADFDNDGNRDLLVALGDPMWYLSRRVRKLHTDDRIFWPARLRVVEYENRTGSANDWLQVELIGDRGNRPGIGAVVTVVTRAGRRLVGQVGDSEGSLHSQGHYRFYFGLGSGDAVESVKVAWPDRQITTLAKPEVNRLIRIAKERN